MSSDFLLEHRENDKGTLKRLLGGVSKKACLMHLANSISVTLQKKLNQCYSSGIERSLKAGFRGARERGDSMCEASAVSRQRACQSLSLDNVTRRFRCSPSTSTPTCPQSLFCSPFAPYTGLSSGPYPPSPPFLKPSQARPSLLVSPLQHQP